MPGVVLQMPLGVGKAGAKFGDVFLPGAPKMAQDSCSEHSGGGRGHAPRCVLGITVRIGVRAVAR